MEERKENKWAKFGIKVASFIGVVIGYVGFCFGKAWLETYGMPRWIMWSIIGVLATLAVIYFIKWCKKVESEPHDTNESNKTNTEEN